MVKFQSLALKLQLVFITDSTSPKLRVLISWVNTQKIVCSVWFEIYRDKRLLMGHFGPLNVALLSCVELSWIERRHLVIFCFKRVRPGPHNWFDRTITRRLKTDLSLIATGLQQTSGSSSLSRGALFKF